MTRNRILAIVVLLICSVVAVASWKGQSQTNTPDAFRFDAKNLNDTALWTKVNAAPYYISSQLDALCAGPTGMNYARERKYNPHAATFITVYINAIGRSAMFEKESPLFPIGSVIVKHKIERTADHTTLLYTIMRKREKGYNPDVGDWEFNVVNADGTTVEASGKIENCQGCHVKKTTSDFVFRPYVAFK
jgi:cytochrome P460